MCAMRPPSSSRRATVLVMVVGVLAMLFIIGSTLLIVARFEKNTGEIKDEARQFKAIGDAFIEPVLHQLRKDVVGDDGIPYNRRAAAAGVTDSSLIEDCTDLPGYLQIDNAEPDRSPNPRTGDLLVASIEPMLEPLNVTPERYRLRYYGMSWLQELIETAPQVSEQPTNKRLLATLPLPPNSPPENEPVGKPNIGEFYDVDGDGVLDTWLPASWRPSNLAGETLRGAVRVIPHGGMVLLDPMTHPSLLGQALHYTEVPSVAAGGVQTLVSRLSALHITPAMEASLRRRFHLPGALGTEIARLPTNDIRRVFPVTLGHTAPTNATSQFKSLTPHTDLVNYTTDRGISDLDWWVSRMRPQQAITSLSPIYSANADVYDRRHLLTTVSSDDILRPQRDDKLPIDLPLLLAGGVATFDRAINPMGDEPGALVPAYGQDANGTLRFNVDGLRTQFSLRDVLNLNGEATYARAVQLTAYFFEMMRQTTAVVGVGMQEQLSAAAQLAVNSIDFADPDNVPTRFTWTGTYTIDVVGIEKQPYVTEAYAKVIHRPAAGANPTTWNPLAILDSVYAIEVYNPYDVPLNLQDYAIVIGGNPGIRLDTVLNTPTGDYLQPRQYVVIANRSDDVTGPTDPFVSGASIWPSAGWNMVILGAGLILPGGSPVHLVRNEVYDLQTNALVQGPAIDTLAPSGLGGDDNDWAKGPADLSGGSPDLYVDDPNRPAAPPCPLIAPYVVRRPGQTISSAPNGVTPTADYLVRDSSLQRRKEPVGYYPLHWQFTLSRQMLFPFAADELADATNSCAAVLTTERSRPAQHSLLATATTSQQWVQDEFDGIAIITSPGGKPLTSGYAQKDPIAPFPVLTSRSLPESAHPAADGEWWYALQGNNTAIQITVQAGYDFGSGQLAIYDADDISASPLATVSGAGATDNVITIQNRSVLRFRLTGTGASTNWGFKVSRIVGHVAGVDHAVPLAYPTTGSLLLVTRYAHTTTEPMTVTATRKAPGSNVGTDLLQMQKIDNGHMPIVDKDQESTDIAGKKGRFDCPWGQLVYHYFTALPLEELTREYNLTGVGLSAKTIPIHLSNEAQYRDAYKHLFPGYPLNSPVTLPSGGVALGAKVHGRVNINYAPWWILDGLPFLPYAKGPGPITSLTPVAELDYERLDSVGYDKFNKRPGGQLLANICLDETREKQNDLASSGGYQRTATAGQTLLRQTNASAIFAKAMVAYREHRNDPADHLALVALANNGTGDHKPGFLSPGSVVEAFTRVPYQTQVVTPSLTLPLGTVTFGDLRTHGEPVTNPTIRPFSYLGYLHMVAPLVRMQDWATVRNHVFTVYTLVGDTRDNDKQNWVRTQTTVDRTRSLYTNDLPDRVAEIAPVGYYDTVSDQ